jgi:TPR repeat protein
MVLTALVPGALVPAMSEQHKGINPALLAKANKGDAVSERLVGLAYMKGQGVDWNYAEAATWFRKAAAHGDAWAQFNLALLYRDGVGVPQDNALAAEFYRKAADQGLARAQYNLALLYEHGDGVPHDDAQAASWYRKAADQQFSAAEFNLGLAYENGRGVAADGAQALGTGLCQGAVEARPALSGRQTRSVGPGAGGCLVQQSGRSG